MKREIQPQSPAPQGAGKVFWLLLGAVAVIAVAVIAMRSWRSDAGYSASARPDPVVAPEPRGGFETNPQPVTVADLPGSKPKPAPVPPPVIPAPELPPPSAESRQLVNGVWQLDPAAGPMTAERAAQWKQNFAQLIQGGSNSVPAIAEFLRLNKDWAFDAADAKLLGYGSARTAMLDALVQIGGAEGIGVLGEILQTTAVPREIALLARNLETLAPEQYRAQAVEAARQTLNMAVEKQLEGFDVAPLFEVIQKYGGPEVVSDLQQATSQWNYYATLALGNLPDGAGVPSLISMATLGPDNKPNPGRLQALQVLAQLASAHPDARAALLEQARADQISANFWPYLARPLSGDEAHVQDSVLNENLSKLARKSTGASHINHNNQNFFYAPVGGGLTVEQANQQLALVNELAAVTPSPDAQRVLQQSRTLLEQRLGRAIAKAAPPQ